MRVKRFLLRFLFVQLAERVFRLNKWLDAADDVSQSGARIITLFRERLRDTLARTQRWIRRLDDYPSDDVIAQSVLRQLLVGFNDLDDLHLALGYLGGNGQPQEIELFIRSVFEPTATLLKRSAQVSVVLSDRYMFEETALDWAVGTRIASGAGLDKTSTVLLPKIENRNPLNWCALVHEFGHSTFSHFRRDLPEQLTSLTALQMGTPSNENQVLGSWLEETFCDLLATKLLGPAYVASYVDFVVGSGAPNGVEGASFTHPDSRFRLYAMDWALKQDAVLAPFKRPIADCRDLTTLVIKIFEARAEFGALLMNERDNRPGFVGIDTRRFRQRLVDDIEHVLPSHVRVAPLEERRIDSLHARLDRDIPIATYCKAEFDQPTRDVAQMALSELETLVEDSARPPSIAKLKRMLGRAASAIDEVPCTVAEILNAAWIYKWEKIYAPFVEQPAIRDKATVKTLAAAFERLDTIIRASIEMSYLAREFSRHRPTMRGDFRDQ